MPAPRTPPLLKVEAAARGLAGRRRAAGRAAAARASRWHGRSRSEQRRRLGDRGGRGVRWAERRHERCRGDGGTSGAAATGGLMAGRAELPAAVGPATRERSAPGEEALAREAARAALGDAQVLGGRAGGGFAGQMGGAAGTSSTGGTSGFNPCKVSPCVVLPLGDSITHGYSSGDDAGYRSALFKLAVAANQKVTFIGSLSNGPATVSGQTFPKMHEGHDGITVTGITAYVPPMKAFSTTPHVVLLHIGTNDMTSNAESHDDGQSARHPGNERRSGCARRPRRRREDRAARLQQHELRPVHREDPGRREGARVQGRTRRDGRHEHAAELRHPR